MFFRYTPRLLGKGVLLCLLLFLNVLFLQAQQDISGKIDKIIVRSMNEEGFPAVAVAVVQNGNVVFKKTYGVKVVEGKQKPDDHTVFCIGSVSKAFTSVGLMLLVQNGKIGLDEPIKKYLKDLPEAWRNITIRQYMTHCSGIPQLIAEKDAASFEATVRQAGKLPMAFTPPGKKEQYNNFNFAILGKLIETVTGMDYLDYMSQNVFTPLGMKTTGVQPATNNIAMGHLLKNGKWKVIETHFKAGDFGVPSGGLQITLADFIAFSQGLYGKKLLNKKTTDAMWTPYSATITNTPGWHSRMADRQLVIHKGGGGTGIGSVCDYKIVPSQNLYVIVMTNKANNKISPADISDDILWQCFKIPKDRNGANEGEGNEH